MTFKPRNLFLKILSKSERFATIRVNWFSSNALSNPTDSTKVDEVLEDENQFAWKVEYLTVK
jgi:hypothetical protein